MPPAVLVELLRRHDLGAVLAAIPEGYRTTFARDDNLRPFLEGSCWSKEAVEGLFRFRDFLNFLHTFAFTRFLFHSADDLRLLIRGVLDGLGRQRIVYAEISISSPEYVDRGLPLAEIVACLEEATAHPAVRVQWIVDLVRDFGPEHALRHLRELLALRSPAVVGITLGGSEDCYPQGAFGEVFALAREHGLRRSVHAGEALGPESVWSALKSLAPERIGHGVRAIEDPHLVEYLASHQIPLEVCPTSNIFTRAYPSYDAHPAKRLFDAGLRLTINSDDPAFFHTTLAEEYAHLAALGFTMEEIGELLRNGFRCAFLPQNVIAGYLAAFNREWTAPPA